MNYKSRCIRDFEEIIFKLNAMIDKINKIDNNKIDFDVRDDIIKFINETHLSSNIKSTLRFVAMYHINR